MKVVIFDDGFIPGLGRGPFRTPIEISEDKYFLYKQMGIKVINASKSVPIAESGIRNRVTVKKEDIPIIIEEPIKEEIVKNIDSVDSIKETVKESVKKEVVEEIIPETDVEETVVEDTVTVEETIEDELTDEISLDEEITESPSQEEISLDDLTKKELMAMLDEKEVTYQSTMLKSELIDLVKEAYEN